MRDLWSRYLSLYFLGKNVEGKVVEEPACRGKDLLRCVWGEDEDLGFIWGQS